MQNPRIASRYAKSLLDLSIEQNNVDSILEDIKMLDSICTQSPEFTQMLRSPVISADKKEDIITAVMGGKLEQLTAMFIDLLNRKGREGFLPEIAKEYIKQYKQYKNILTVIVTAATPLEDSVKDAIRAKVATANPNQAIDMEVKVDASLIGGFTIEIEDKLIDTSIRRSLGEVRKSFHDKSYTVQMH